MSTLNGFGTLYYGWRHSADNTATATRWFAVSWVPIIPLRRERLRVLTNFNNPGQNIRVELGGLVISQVDHYELLERLPLSLGEVLVTLAKTFIGLPLLLLGPVLLLALGMKLAQAAGVDIKPGSMPFAIFMGGTVLSLVNVLYQAVRAIRRARGWQPNIQSLDG